MSSRYAQELRWSVERIGGTGIEETRGERWVALGARLGDRPLRVELVQGVFEYQGERRRVPIAATFEVGGGDQPLDAFAIRRDGGATWHAAAGEDRRCAMGHSNPMADGMSSVEVRLFLRWMERLATCGDDDARDAVRQAQAATIARFADRGQRFAPLRQLWAAATRLGGRARSSLAKGIREAIAAVFPDAAFTHWPGPKDDGFRIVESLRARWRRGGPTVRAEVLESLLPTDDPQVDVVSWRLPVSDGRLPRRWCVLRVADLDRRAWNALAPHATAASADELWWWATEDDLSAGVVHGLLGQLARATSAGGSSPYR